MRDEQACDLSGTPCVVSLGGNLGDVPAAMREAVSQLDQLDGIQVGRLSSIHRTSAVGEHAGNHFSNAALHIRTRLDPQALLEQLQQVETRLGRVRDRYFGPRTIDLDILFYGSQVIERPTLSIPHPACWFRRFVLDPLVEIAPGLLHPGQQLSVKQLRDRLLVRPLSIGVVGGDSIRRATVCDRLRSGYDSGRLRLFDHPAQWGSVPPTIIIWMGWSQDDTRGVDFESLPVGLRVNATGRPCGPSQCVLDVVASALPD